MTISNRGIFPLKKKHCGTDKRLQIDPIDYKTKKFDVTPALRSKPWEEILVELKKCQLLCKECHKIKTKKEGSNLVKIKGSANGQSKLTEQDVIAVKQLLLNKEPCRSIAEKFKVSRETISAIKIGRSWSHINIVS
jgi:hypothetical protein